jgi:protein-L-isoaspartate O-methyltransferase
VYHVLDALPRGTFCEWGSGMGIITGIAAMLGFDATGIELNPKLASASRELLADYGLKATIVTGDYLEIAHGADYYFVYCWPGQMISVEARFLASAPQSAKLLICHGSEDVRCKAPSRLNGPNCDT